VRHNGPVELARPAAVPVLPPGPRGGPLFGSLRRLRRDPLGFFLELRARYGDVAHFRAGPYRVYLLSHPDLVREVLVTRHHSFMKSQVLQEAKRVLGEGLLTSEGDLHRRQRRLLNPLFHHDRIASYAGVMAECAARLAERWRPGAVVDVHQEMSRLTLAIVGRALFGADVEDAAAHRVAWALRAAFDMYERFLTPYARYVERLPLPSNRRFERARRALDEVLFELIRERRAEGDRGDLLSRLLSARDEEEGHGPMTDRQARDEAMTLFLAGHETTSLALTWAWYLLSDHPEAEARLHEEVDRVLGDRLPGASDVPALAHTRRVLAEAVRLYPPAWAMGRRALEDVEVGGGVVPRGATVVMSQYLIHRDPRWWRDPDRFDPDRWLEPEGHRPRFAYFPFGGGPRVCIGEDFAWTEGVILLATLARRWRLRLVPGHPVALAPRITLRPRHGMPMTVEPR
jgi:cytochrome P450